MDGYADNIPNFDDNYEYGDTFFDFDAASSSNGMGMAVMQHTHDAADWTPSIQDSLDYMPFIMGSSGNLAPDSRHGGHASAPTGKAIPGMTVAPYEGETSNTPNHSHTKEPVDFFSYDPGFDNIGEDPYSRNSALGSYADDQPPAPGPLYHLDAGMAYSEQQEYSGRPAGISTLVAPSPMLDQSENFSRLLPTMNQSTHAAIDDHEHGTYTSNPDATYSDHAFHRFHILTVQQREDLQDQVLGAWSVGSKCTWPGCTSRATFKTQAPLTVHLDNIHVNPLLCKEPHCEWKKPFAKRYDLRRHHVTVHSKERRYACKVTSCDAPIKEFARKDHLIIHMRERHDNYYCPMNHCRRGKGASFATPEELAEHIQNFHDGDTYECAIGACARGSSSNFNWDSVHGHLANHHRFARNAPWYIMMNMQSRDGRTVRQVDIPRGIPLHDCKICGTQDGVAEV